MDELTLPDRRTMYFQTPTDPATDPEGVALVQDILDRKREASK